VASLSARESPPASALTPTLETTMALDDILGLSAHIDALIEDFEHIDVDGDGTCSVVELRRVLPDDTSGSSAVALFAQLADAETGLITLDHLLAAQRDANKIALQRTAQMSRDSPIPSLLLRAIAEKARVAEEERKAARGRAEIEAEARKERDELEIANALSHFHAESTSNPAIALVPLPELGENGDFAKSMRLILEVNLNRNARRRFGLDDPAVQLLADVRFGGRVVAEFRIVAGGSRRETIFVCELDAGHVVHPQSCLHITVLRLPEDATPKVRSSFLLFVRFVC
jgi:hypothetical protein